MNDKYWTVQDVAKLIGKDQQTIIRYIKAGKLKAEKGLKQWYIKQSDLEQFMSSKIETEYRLYLTRTEINILTSVLEKQIALDDAAGSSLENGERGTVLNVLKKLKTMEARVKN